jgi:hypothetical protein
MPELHRNLKQGILDTLRLWASREAQLEYRRTVPIADVSAELFCMWDEVFWLDDTALRAEFSETAWSALQRFHSIFERVGSLLPHHPLPPIEEFILSPHWLQISRAAARALRTIDSAL